MLPPTYLGIHQLNYVQKSKVLGVIIDSLLSFRQHAKLILSRCWHRWFQLSQHTTRSKGLNTSSLILLFKTCVLTILLYASPIWLDGNLEVFRDFMSRATLKIIGAQFHPPKMLTYTILGLPPLELLHLRIVIKFVLKCLFQQDDTTARIFQIEESPGHPFYKHITEVKDFLKNKFDVLQQLRNRDLQLSSLNQDHFKYEKNEVLFYICKRWDSNICSNLPSILIKDPYSVEDSEELQKRLAPYIKTGNTLRSTLFKRCDRRYENTQVADFLHGRSLRFQNFAHTILKIDKTKHFV